MERTINECLDALAQCCKDSTDFSALEQIRSHIAEGVRERAPNSAMVQLLCDVKGLLLNNDTPSREARAEIIGAINAVLAQQHQ